MDYVIPVKMLFLFYFCLYTIIASTGCMKLDFVGFEVVQI